MLLLTFLSFSLAAQNPSRLHDFTSIPSILTVFPNIFSYFLYFFVISFSFLPFAFISYYFQVVIASFSYFLPFPASSRYFLRWVLLLTFRSFSLAAQNPSRLHDFTSIPSILSDIEANGCFCLLFAVSAWPPRTPPDCTILLAFLQF